MSYYDALKAKWAMLSGDAAAKLVALNAATVAGASQPVPILDLVTYLRRNNLWLPIKAAAAAGTSPGALAAVDLNSDLRAQLVDFNLPIVQGMVGDLITHGLLSQGQANEMTAMAASTRPWWEANGYSSPIGQGDLDAAGLT